MPMYDFECPHGHRFEYNCLIADRDDKIPCKGVVPQLISDDELELAEAGELEGARVESVGYEGEEEIWVKDVPCMLKAKHVEISFSGTNLILDHGSASNRDAAREGRYDPLNPNTRFMAKGRQWRK